MVTAFSLTLELISCFRGEVRTTALLVLLDHVVVRICAVTAEVDGEVVALDAATGMCFGLNGTASQVWRMIEVPIAVTDLCTALVQDYEVDRETCERDVLELLTSLKGAGLIESKPSATLRSTD